MTDLEAIDREIDELGLRGEVEAQMAEYEALMQPTYVPGLGVVSTLAAQMLADADFYFLRPRSPRCYSLGAATVHVKPWCRCPKRRR